MSMLQSHIASFEATFPELLEKYPWHIARDIKHPIAQALKACDSGFVIKGDIAVHKTATIEEHVVLRGPMIIGQRCFIGAHAYLRGGVFLSNNVSVGPGCEIKSSIIMENSAMAHFNFVGDSIIGSHVNLEAGSIVANHHNDRSDKTIYVLVDGLKKIT
jgi:UDP-N-acetylglucosamine diphosphorylase / glucose-1-phosphate thymidylyltransferase / UDP-N-acetylgalactosamine diphosphorylase / glucosamine-1-phosphate N-acetyltransferase / galactosamine-1-phosphate N-acetyltransferase